MFNLDQKPKNKKPQDHVLQSDQSSHQNPKHKHKNFKSFIFPFKITNTKILDIYFSLSKSQKQTQKSQHVIEK